MAKTMIQPLVYVDACVYIDLITRNIQTSKESGEQRWHVAKKVFDAVNGDQVRLASSSLIEAEVCCNGPARKGNERVRSLVGGWFTARSTVWTEVDRHLAREAVRIMNEHRHKASGEKKMSAADALHLAAAVRLQCDYFMTHDEGFPLGHKFEGLQVIRPQVVWPEQLFAQASGG